MRIRDVMTPEPQTIDASATLQEAAQCMRDLDVGSLPVCSNDNLIGYITDRDIVVRAEAEGKNPTAALVRDAMTDGVACCFEDDPIEQAVSMMEERQIRRLPVMDKDKRLVGVVSLGDLAVNANKKKAGEALEQISIPAHPRR